MFFSKKWQFLLILVLVSSGCKTSKSDTSTIESVAQDYISNIGTTTYNADKTYLLAVEELTPENEFIKFVVLSVSDQKIILEKQFRPGHVKWFDNTTIELLDTPGMIEENKKSEDYIQYLPIILKSTE